MAKKYARTVRRDAELLNARIIRSPVLQGGHHAFGHMLVFNAYDAANAAHNLQGSHSSVCLCERNEVQIEQYAVTTADQRPEGFPVRLSSIVVRSETARRQSDTASDCWCTTSAMVISTGCICVNSNKTSSALSYCEGQTSE